MTIESPCVRVCKLDTRGICPGCLRTADEIARWTQMTEHEKFAVVAASGARRLKPGEIYEAKLNE